MRCPLLPVALAAAGLMISTGGCASSSAPDTARPLALTQASASSPQFLEKHCRFNPPEFFGDQDEPEDYLTRYGPPSQEGGTGRLQAPAIRIELTDPPVAGRPYPIRAEVVHDTGLQNVKLGWATDMKEKWEYTCGGPKPPGVQVDCIRIGYVYQFLVVPPAGVHSFGISARAVDGGQSATSVGVEFKHCGR